MISVAEFDLAGSWLTRDGHRAVVEINRTPVARYRAVLDNGVVTYIDAEGKAHGNHAEYDLMERVRQAAVHPAFGKERKPQ